MSSKYFRNCSCEYYPCHKDIKDNVFNCLFCYCPLYCKSDCGGNYKMINRIKDCSDCTFPHMKSNYDKIVRRFNK